MTIYFFFDTETDGPKPSANCLQLAGKLIDSQLKKITTFNTIINAPISHIPQGASNVHGLYVDNLQRMGISQDTAFSYFIEHANNCDIIVAHNVIYDFGIMRTMATQLNKLDIFEDVLSKKEIVCTMKLATDIVQLPPTAKMKAVGMNNFKPPKLEEVYKFFFKKKLSGAHDAMVDVEACIKIFFKIKQMYS